MIRVLLSIIRVVSPEDEREWVIGDTLEELYHIQETKGTTAARCWLTAECLRVLLGAAAHRRAVASRTPSQSAARRGWRHLVEQVTYDTTYFVRRSLHARAFTATAVAVFALGIAANVTVFSIADAVLLKPAAFPDADRVVFFETVSPAGVDLGASPAMYEHWRAQTDIVEDVTAFRNVVLNDTTGTAPEQVRGSLVSHSYFRLFGASFARGRRFSEVDGRSSSTNVAIVSHRMWLHRFNSADVVGYALRLNGVTYTVVGVLGPSFRMDDAGPSPDVWLPLQLHNEAKTQGHFLWVCGRLGEGISLAQARARLQVAAEQFRRDFPTALPDSATFSVQPFRDALVRNARPLFVVLIAAVAFVLLIACSNVATLLLLQGASRRREIAVRAALGAPRRRIVRQLFTETLLLSGAGGLIGLALGWVALRLLPAIGFSGLPRLDALTSLAPDWRVVSFTVVTTLGTALLSGVVPALRVSRIDLSAAMSSVDMRAGRGPHRRTTEPVLVALQVSLALVLLIGCGLFVRTVAALTKVDAGFDSERVLTMRTSLSGPQFAGATDADALVRRGVEALEAVRDVTSAAAAYGLPLEDGFGLPFEIVGRPLPPGRPFHGGAAWMAVSAGYFEALAIPVMRGREFTAADRQSSLPVVVINEVMARQHWPGEDPIGKRLVLGHGIGPQFQDEPVREIVGVVGSVRQNRLADAPGALVYEPIAQLPDVANAFVATGTPMAWIARTRTAPETLAPTLGQVLEHASGLPVTRIQSMDEVVGRSILRERLAMWLMAAFGSAALLLSSIGLYGLIGYTVEQRVSEIGIRLALGANASLITRMVVCQGLRVIAAGTVAGSVAALLMTRAITRLLFGVSPWDLATFAAVSALVALVAALAVWLPARRASRVDPIVALRYE